MESTLRTAAIISKVVKVLWAFNIFHNWNRFQKLPVMGLSVDHSSISLSAAVLLMALVCSL